MTQTKSFTFFIFRNSFIQNYRFLYHGDQKISWWRICRWRAVNFEIHLCSSGVTAFGDRPASSVSKLTASVNSDLGNGSFWLEIPHAEQDVVRCSWNMREFDRINWPLTSEMFTFVTFLQWSYLKAVSVPTFVSNRRPAGLHRDERSCSMSQWSL